jgi:hypothetical protein
VIPNRYVIKGCQANAQLSPRSWKLEGSIDGGEWEVLDHQNNSTDLAGAGMVKAWTIEKEVECRYLRLTSTGPTSSGNQCLGLSYFDVFGTLIE